MTMDQEIRAFEEYALHRGWSTATRTVRVYALRAALSQIADPTDAEEVALYHDSLAHTTRKNFRANWRSYIQFRQECGLHPFPANAPIGIRGKSTPAIRCSLPDEVVVALRALVRDGIPPKALAALRWKDVIEDGTLTRFRAILDRKVHSANVERSYAPLTIAGRVALGDLRSWAAEVDGRDPAPELPLVPMRPGSHIPASAGLIRQVVHDPRQAA